MNNPQTIAPLFTITIVSGSVSNTYTHTCREMITSRLYTIIHRLFKISPLDAPSFNLVDIIQDDNIKLEISLNTYSPHELRAKSVKAKNTFMGRAFDRTRYLYKKNNEVQKLMKIVDIFVTTACNICIPNRDNDAKSVYSFSKRSSTMPLSVEGGPVRNSTGYLVTPCTEVKVMHTTIEYKGIPKQVLVSPIYVSFVLGMLRTGIQFWSDKAHLTVAGASALKEAVAVNKLKGDELKEGLHDWCKNNIGMFSRHEYKNNPGAFPLNAMTLNSVLMLIDNPQIVLRGSDMDNWNSYSGFMEWSRRVDENIANDMEHVNWSGIRFHTYEDGTISLARSHR